MSEHDLPEQLNMVQVVYGAKDSVIRLDVNYKKNMTAEMAIEVSEILKQINALEPHSKTDIDLATTKIGVFGELVHLGHILSAGDRVEIYRPLLIDPKQARRERALLDASEQ